MLNQTSKFNLNTKKTFEKTTNKVVQSNDKPMASIIEIANDSIDISITKDNTINTNTLLNITYFEATPYDIFLKFIFGFAGGSILINVRHVNKHFYELITETNIYKKTHPYDRVLDAIITDNKYIIGSKDPSIVGLFEIATLPKKLDFYKYVLLNQDKKKLTDKFIIECSEILCLTKADQIYSWASYGNATFLEIAADFNQKTYENNKNVEMSQSKFSSIWAIEHWYINSIHSLSKHMDIYSFAKVPEDAATTNNIPVIKWLFGLDPVRKSHMIGYDLIKRMMIKSTSAKQYGLLESLVIDNPSFALINKQICYEIAKNGDLVQLTFFHSKMGCPLAIDISISATQGGNMAVLEYVMENGASVNERNCEIAAELGNLPMLTMLKRQFKCRWNENTIIAAIKNKHDHIAMWALLNECPASGKCCTTLVSTGNLDLLKFFIKNGCPWDSNTFDAAVCSGSMDFVEYCYYYGCPCYDDLIETSAAQANVDIFQFCVGAQLGKPNNRKVYSNCQNNPNSKFLNWYKTIPIELGHEPEYKIEDNFLWVDMTDDSNDY